ncbi:chemotaxis protein CheW [Muricoccus radiodurans]|uniref:chemotaxis protein CheW n=1 Tax=Muricoccus radiodurans TaxID=2231721 RepID=UPI003CF51BC1
MPWPRPRHGPRPAPAPVAAGEPPARLIRPLSDAAPPAAFILFATAGTNCALPREAVRELLPLPRLDAPPGLPGPLAGFMNLGGTAVPVLDLAALLGAGSTQIGPYAHLLLLAGPPRALLVDRVLDVWPAGGVPPRPVDPAHSLGGLIVAELESDGGTAHLLDAGQVLLAQEAAILADLSATAQRRLDAWAGARGSPDGSA